MTNEEAIRKLDTMWKMLTSAYDDIADSHVEAYTMAVDALKAQGTCEDAVSRQAIQKELALYPIDDVTSEDEAGYNRAINDVQKMVVHLPSVQPKYEERTAESAQNVPKEDLISRKAAIDAVKGLPTWWADAGGYYGGAQPPMTALLDPEDTVAAIDNLPSAQPNLGKYEYHYDHTDCIWYRPEARNRCPVTCAQYRDGWNDAMNYIFRDGKGYMPYRRDKQYGE